MVLREMVTIEAQAIVELDEVKTLRVEIGQWQLVAIEVVKNAELHGSPSGGPTVKAGGAKMIDF